MSKECKQARNTVLMSIVLLVGVLLFCSSCASNTSLPCAAYASVEKNK